MSPPEKLRILVTGPNLAGGGAERMTLNLASALSREKFDVGLFLHERSGPYMDKVPADVDFHWHTTADYRRWRTPALFRQMLRLARAYDVVVGANEGRATFLACLAGWWLKKPVIGWIHNDWRPYVKQVSWRQGLGFRWIYPRLARVVCCSETARDGLLELTCCAPQKAITIPNFIFNSQVVKAQTEPPPDWAEPILAKPTIVSMARLDPQKGLDTLIRAHAQLRRGGGTQNLLLLGEGPLREELEQLAVAEGVKDSTYLPGFARNPFTLIKRATVFALPSRFEGFGLALIEAMVCGAPVVASDCLAFAEVLDKGRYGLMVPVGDVPALAQALGQLLADPALRATWAAKAVQGGRRFSYEAVQDAWENLVLDVARAALFRKVFTSGEKVLRRW